MGSTKFKDYFGNATRQFKFESKGVKLEKSDNELSLYEQLEKYGTPEEKVAVRRMKEKKEIDDSRNLRKNSTTGFDKGPGVDPYK